VAEADYRSFYQAIHENSRDRPDKKYLVSADDGVAISHGELFSATNRLSRFLGQMGLGANDRVMLLAGNGLTARASARSISR
jgi:acyl-CoA synthetase (AMP-forming)/AMP-acid ligase II